jgi:hypothetical protein
MNLDSQSSMSVKANEQSQNEILSISIMVPTASSRTSITTCRQNKQNPFRHSTGTMDDSSSQQLELSLSDFDISTKPRRASIRKNRRASSSAMEDSSRTATTANSSDNHYSASLCGSNYSQRRASRSRNGSIRRPSLESLQNGDATDDGSHQFSCQRRGSSLNDLDNASSTRTREVRDLRSLHRRRSDPCTRRWREQCSKIYQEQVLLLDPCLEQQQRDCMPPLMATVQQQAIAATKIQSWMRRRLSQYHQQRDEHLLYHSDKLMP